MTQPPKPRRISSEGGLDVLMPLESYMYFWTFQPEDGEVFDAEFHSVNEAQTWADQEFAERCQNNDPRTNEEFEEKIDLIRFYIDEFGDRKVVEIRKSAVIYCHYPVDQYC